MSKKGTIKNKLGSALVLGGLVLGAAVLADRTVPQKAWAHEVPSPCDFTTGGGFVFSRIAGQKQSRQKWNDEFYTKFVRDHEGSIHEILFYLACELFQKIVYFSKPILILAEKIYSPASIWRCLTLNQRCFYGNHNFKQAADARATRRIEQEGARVLRTIARETRKRTLG